MIDVSAASYLGQSINDWPLELAIIDKKSDERFGNELGMQDLPELYQPRYLYLYLTFILVAQPYEILAQPHLLKLLKSTGTIRNKIPTHLAFTIRSLRHSE